ncbi:MAG: hypothetical protein SGARI_005240, partial [Bacillariaceae sp.]
MTKSSVTTTVALLAIAGVASVEGFTTPATSGSVLSRTTTTNTQLAFGIPSFGPKSDDDEEEDPNLEKKSIGMKGLVQLITAGAGSPFLGDFEGVDKETGKFMFSLEANNLTDEEGNSKQTSMPYFESGWVDPKDAEKAKEGNGF